MTENIKALVEKAFGDAGIAMVSLQVRSFPGETIVVVEVAKDYERALSVASNLDSKIENGFVTVRRASTRHVGPVGSVKNVADSRVTDLLELLNARSRASESQPSLRFIGNVDERLNLAISPRHQLIFGRRGVGKTSLLLEAKRVLEESESLVLWVNMHSLRSLTAQKAFLTIMLRLCDMSMSVARNGLQSTQLISQARTAMEQALYSSDSADVAAFVPLLQQAIARFCVGTGQRIFIFLDDVHYLRPAEVPYLLDMLHGISRDNPLWLKVAGIQHQMRWFIQSPPTGLQTGHDAVILNLDVTLEHPERAKTFLQDVLKGYLEESGALPISAIISREAIDRLVLASGGVPRDFLTLCAGSIQTARLRPKASAVGVQDVNNAAGVAGQTKLQELEDDAAATSGRSALLVEALNRIRYFLLTQEQITFFRVDFRDKEVQQEEYRQLQALADMRMLHLINGSLSDPQHAGQRSEVYLLDLSQYSGSRLKQRIKVLDFERGHMVLKHTRSNEPQKAGDTSLRLVQLLRQGPAFPLSSLTGDENGSLLL